MSVSFSLTYEVVSHKKYEKIKLVLGRQRKKIKIRIQVDLLLSPHTSSHPGNPSQDEVLKDKVQSVPRHLHPFSNLSVVSWCDSSPRMK